MMLLVLYLMVGQTFVRGLSDCKPFPKIFGGKTGHTYVNQIDAYEAADMLVQVGYTADSSLTGSS
jgi:hypothetical protein